MAESVPAQEVANDYSKMTRDDFPLGFVFGTGTSAYQVEGAAATGGRGVSVWDDFAMRTPNKISDGSNGNVAVDMYNRYKDDIRMMKNMGFDAYRFSISWSRIIPSGKKCLGVNKEGIDYYNDLIDTIHAHGMQPHVTLFHWDLPDLLAKEYGGFLSEEILNDYCDYVYVCFWKFGNRVRHWTTFNEPWTYCYQGYVTRAYPSTKISTINDPHDEAFVAAKNMIVAHAKAVDLYNTKFKELQGGQIGIVLNNYCFEPFDSTSEEDTIAARRAHDFKFGWFLEPVLTGKYPETMRPYIPDEAKFKVDEIKLLTKHKIDFLGVNYYTARYVKDYPNANIDPHLSYFDKLQKVKVLTSDVYGNPIGPCPSGGPSWLYVVPWGVKKLLKKINNFYNKPPYNVPAIYITENGVAEANDPRKTADEVANDTTRVEYYRDHLGNILDVINEWKPLLPQKKLEIKGFFAWSWIDKYEWTDGYGFRYGIVYTDYMNNLTRYPKNSAIWFSQFLAGKIPQLLPAP